jgi:hypothetical protein
MAVAASCAGLQPSSGIRSKASGSHQANRGKDKTVNQEVPTSEGGELGAHDRVCQEPKKKPMEPGVYINLLPGSWN